MIRKKKFLATALCAGGVVLSAVMAQDVTESTTTPTTETGTSTADTATTTGTTETGATVTTLVSQPFATAVDSVTSLNNEEATAWSGTWAGYGSVTNQTGDGAGYTKPTGVGSPINDATDKLYLSVDGYVTCTAATTASRPATVDMMIQIARPDEALAMPTGETTTDIQIAVGVDSDGSLKVYCKDKDGNAAWYPLGTATYEEGEWHRVSFTFDYANQRCQIRLDGEPLMTSNGTLTSDGATTATASGSTAIGSWYKLNAATATSLSSVKVVGSTAIDEVVIKEAATATATVADVLPALADATSETTDGVPYSWIEQQGITRAQAAGDAPDNSGMKVADKYRTGLPIGDGKTFAISAMGMTGDGGNLKATLTVPAMTPPDGYKNVIVYGSSPEDLTNTQNVPSSASEQTIELSVSKAATGATKIYYQLKNVSTAD